MLVFDVQAEPALEFPRRIGDRLRLAALDDSLLRCVPHAVFAAFGVSRGHHLEILHGHEFPDLQLPPAGDRQRRRLDPPDPGHAP